MLSFLFFFGRQSDRYIEKKKIIIKDNLKTKKNYYQGEDKKKSWKEG